MDAIRRRILSAGAAALTLDPLRTALAYMTDAPKRQPEILRAAAKLGQFVRNRESGAVVGRLYLQQFPDEGDIGRMVDLIVQDDPAFRRDLRYGPRDRVREGLRTRHNADLAAGRVVKLNGWLLSVTEARLYGLTSVTSRLKGP